MVMGEIKEGGEERGRGIRFYLSVCWPKSFRHVTQIVTGVRTAQTTDLNAHTFKKTRMILSNVQITVDMAAAVGSCISFIPA